ncbi:hypothetical protein JOM56_009036 [Amanita muscaria]
MLGLHQIREAPPESLLQNPALRHAFTSAVLAPITLKANGPTRGKYIITLNKSVDKATKKACWASSSEFHQRPGRRSPTTMRVHPHPFSRQDGAVHDPSGLRFIRHLRPDRSDHRRECKWPDQWQIHLTLKEGVNKADLFSQAKTFNVTHKWDIINGFAGHCDDSTLDYLRAHSDVESIAEDGIVTINSLTTH